MDRLGDKVCCNPTVKLKKGEYYPLIDIEKIALGYKTVRNQEEIVFNGQSCTKFEDRDVLFARITPCLENGKIAMAGTNGKCGIGSTELFVFRGIEGISNTDYVYYLLRMNHIRQLAANSMTGASGRQRADLNFIKKIKWQFPVIEQQQKIASILTVYDNLIENNNKRIKILEQMAENLYKEWFVRFRFPNYQNTEIENGIPKGWNVIRLGELCDIVTGKKDANEATGIGKYPFFTCARESNLYTNEYLLDVDAILIAGNGSYTGYVKKYSGRFDLYQRTYALYNFKNVEWLYLYWTMKINFEREFMGGSRGSAIPYITKPNISKYKILLPSKELLKKSQEMFDLIYKKCCLLEQTNQNLIKQRDMLLPRLMSGKLEVK